MARTALTVTEQAPNGRVTRPAGVVGITDGHSVTGYQPEELYLQVVVATAETDVTVKAGANPPALEAADQVFACAIGDHLIGPFTSGKVAQTDGSIHVDYETPANVTVAAVHVPRTA
ncbi:MAG: hypothetical protein L0H84_20070 [Pseudonocardia sp.]|nr:hypothetical protein [Pseudonocardia sp.]